MTKLSWGKNITLGGGGHIARSPTMAQNAALKVTVNAKPVQRERTTPMKTSTAPTAKRFAALAKSMARDADLETNPDAMLAKSLVSFMREKLGASDADLEALKTMIGESEAGSPTAMALVNYIGQALNGSISPATGIEAAMDRSMQHGTPRSFDQRFPGAARIKHF